MNELDKWRELAGIPILNEGMGSPTHQLALQIIRLAEKNAYAEGAKRGSIQMDMVLDAAQTILKDIAGVVLQKLQAEFDTNSQEVDATQVSTAHGFDTGTARDGTLTSADPNNPNNQ